MKYRSPLSVNIYDKSYVLVQLLSYVYSILLSISTQKYE